MWVGGQQGGQGTPGGLPPLLTRQPGPAEAWCLAGDDSTDGSATAPDDDGKDDTKAEDLGEPCDPPGTPSPPVRAR